VARLLTAIGGFLRLRAILMVPEWVEWGIVGKKRGKRGKHNWAKLISLRANGDIKAHFF
jgi:hypothetical protein